MNTDNKGSVQEPHNTFLLSSPQIYTVIMNSLPIGFSLLDRDEMLIEAHRGTMRMESEPGKGSRFWFTLPKKTPGGNR